MAVYCVMRVGTAQQNVITDRGALSFATCARLQVKIPHLGSSQNGRAATTTDSPQPRNTNSNNNRLYLKRINTY